MTEQEIRAKALEIAVHILGEAERARSSRNGKLILDNYLFLADTVEQHIHGTLQQNPAESAGSS
jgi:hypothetical protein